MLFHFNVKWSCTLLKRPILIPPKKKTQLQRRNPCNQKRIQKTILNPLKKVWNFEPPPKKNTKTRRHGTPKLQPRGDRRSASGNLEGLNIGRRSRRKRPPVAHPRHREKQTWMSLLHPKVPTGFHRKMMKNGWFAAKAVVKWSLFQKWAGTQSPLHRPGD